MSALDRIIINREASRLVNILLKLLNMVIEHDENPARFMNILSPKVTVDREL